MRDLSRLPTFAHDDVFHVVVESPRGSAVKLQYQPALGAMSISRPLSLGLSYPYDWGFVPTWDATGQAYVLENGSRVFIFGVKAQDQLARYSKIRGLTLAGIYNDQTEELQQTRDNATPQHVERARIANKSGDVDQQVVGESGNVTRVLL